MGEGYGGSDRQVHSPADVFQLLNGDYDAFVVKDADYYERKRDLLECCAGPM